MGDELDIETINKGRKIYYKLPEKQSADEPIYGPKSNKPDHPLEIFKDRYESPGLKFSRFFADLVRKPTQWIRENIVERFRGPKYYWYHRYYKPPLPVDECFSDDPVCIYEATQHMRREATIERFMLEILEKRFENCMAWNSTKKFSNANYEMAARCGPMRDYFEREAVKYFIKYGDLPTRATAALVYNKQKHRMIMERRKKEREARIAAGEKVPEFDDVDVEGWDAKGEKPVKWHRDVFDGWL